MASPAEVEIPGYVHEVLKEMHSTTLGRVSRATSASTLNEPTLISVVKDEIDRLHDFLRHYRAAGICRFSIIDNGSTDGTVDFLKAQADVDLFTANRPFTWQRKHGWIFLAMMMSGRNENTWFMYADADEHIVFTGMESRTFGELARQMDRKGISRVRGVLLDMYPNGPLLQSRYLSQDNLITSYPYFDRDGYIEEKYREIVSRKGGPRKRAFGHVDRAFRPELTKYPLFRLAGNDVFANPHHVWPYDGNFTSPCYLGILHFKFLPGLVDRVNQAVAQKTYWDNSIEYRCYQRVLSEQPNLSLHGPVSARYESPRSLLECGIIENIPWTK